MNYIGSKLSLQEFIESSIREFTGYTSGDGRVFADIFAGTGAICTAFRQNGYKVIANDNLYFSYVLNKHLVENTQSVLTNPVDLTKFTEEMEGFIYKTYCAGSGSGRNYFSDTNGKRCDFVRTLLESMRDCNEITAPMYYWYLASLINSIDKVANTASVYSAFLKHIKKSAQRMFEVSMLPIIDGIFGEVYNEDANILIRKIQGDILYLDPPYNERQYDSNYHILETVARYDNPEVYGKTGLRRNSPAKSAFCSKKTVKTAFEDIIANANFKYIFLSYNNEGLMGFSDIAEIMGKYGEYKSKYQVNKRFKCDADVNRTFIADSTYEFIHCLKKG
jgi:adenine-specific DNA-methyltransferase